MAFLLGPALGALSSFLFKKKGGRIVKQTPSGQVFVQPKMNGGAVYEKPGRYHQWLIDNPGGIRKKEGGKVKRSKPKKNKKQK